MDDGLTVSAAATELNVRVEYVLELVQGGKLPAHERSGSTYVRRSDVLAYQRKHALEARAALEELAMQARDLRLD